MTTTDLDAALAALTKSLPEMTGAAEAFAVLVRAAGEADACGEDWPPYVEVDAEAFQAGRPLISAIATGSLVSAFTDGALSMLPAIKELFPGVSAQAAAFGAALENLPGFSTTCLAAALSGDEKSLDRASETAQVPAPALLFLARECLKPALRKARASLAPLADDALWCKGHCPVCGSRPDMGYLKEKAEASEFLIAKAGVLRLHCSQCGHGWRFMRLVCPACGEHDHEKQEVLTVEERPGERVHLCKTCSRYLPVADLTGSEAPFNADIAPLGLIHLDILAQERGYKPMVATPWNTFG